MCVSFFGENSSDIESNILANQCLQREASHLQQPIQSTFQWAFFLGIKKYKIEQNRVISLTNIRNSVENRSRDLK